MPTPAVDHTQYNLADISFNVCINHDIVIKSIYQLRMTPLMSKNRLESDQL